MKLSLGISACVHAIVLAALVFLFQAVPNMRLPEGVYSVKILQPFVGSGPSGAAKAEGEKKDAVDVKEPKEEPKKEVEKIPVPKKPDAKNKGDAKKETEAKKETAPENGGEGARGHRRRGGRHRDRRRRGELPLRLLSPGDRAPRFGELVLGRI